MIGHVRQRWRQAGLAAFGLVLAVLALDRAFPPPLKQVSERSVLVSDRDRRPLRAFPASDGRWRFGADLDAIDPVFVDALIRVEDKRYYTHWGVDWFGMVRAAGTSLVAGRIVSGGSTITMQTARLIEPRPRTVGSKLIEMVRAHQLEARLTKREILELYLTLAPYGGNLEGIRAASWAYFGRNPDRLTDDQIALLIALPQSPEGRRPDRRPEGAKRGRDGILAKLEAYRVLTPGRAADAADQPLPGQRRSFPSRAWHGAAQTLAETGRSDVRSTIDANLQKALALHLAAHARTLEPEVQVAAMVVHVPTRAVRAHIGSVSRDRPGGWLDLTAQARSPGSTLKPFIYAMAFDDGAARPETRIMDLPKRFASYQPENFDRGFRGDVRVSEALQHSLNVPAVLALDRVGPERFAAQLALAGASPRVRGGAEDGAGLALALGGAGLTLQELAVLYTALGDDGFAKPLIWSEDRVALERDKPRVRLTSPASAQSILDILKRAPPPEGRAPGRLTASAPQVAYKTGTSYGFRDAWAAGVAGDYASVVWVGRADGAPRPGRTGRDTAAPLLFDVFDSVDAHLGGQGGAQARLQSRASGNMGPSQEQFGNPQAAPQILFPPRNAELWAGAVDGKMPRAFVLSGRGDGPLDWYVDGEPSALDDAGAPYWAPDRSGFYTVTAVDRAGRASNVRVRVIGVPPA